MAGDVGADRPSWGSYAMAFLLLCAVWWIFAAIVRQPYLPTPLEVAGAFVRESGKGLWRHALFSLRRIMAALALSLIAGVPLGICLGRSKAFSRLGSPILYLTFPIPKVVLLPILIMAMGLGDAPKIALIFLTLVYQVSMAVRDAAAGLPGGYLLAMRSLGAGGAQCMRHLVLPYCLPAVFTGLRIGIGTSVAVLFFAETFATSEGLGYLVMDSWGRADYAGMFAGMTAMSILGLVLYIATDLLERFCCPWKEDI